MRWLLLGLVFFLSACTAWERSPGESRFSTPLVFTRPAPADPLVDLDPDHPAANTDRAPAPRRRSPPAPPPQEIRPAAVHYLTSKGVPLTVLAFDDRRFEFVVADKENGPETQWASAKAAAESRGAVAGINASFFTPEGRPLGLVIENGKRFGSWSSGSSLTSGVLAVPRNGPRLLRRTQWSRSASASHLVQAGPLLLEHGKTVAGLSSANSRPRSFVGWDGRHHWIVGSARSATLAQLSNALAAQPLAGSRVEIALNFDGGRSSDLWISPTVKGGPVSTRRFWNKPVRNYLLLRKR